MGRVAATREARTNRPHARQCALSAFDRVVVRGALLRRARRHHAHRRDDREPEFRGDLPAPVALSFYLTKVIVAKVGPSIPMLDRLPASFQQPVVSGLISAYQAHLKAATADATIAADLAGKEIAAQTSETNAIMQYRIAEIGHWYEPDKLMGYLVVCLLAKLILWDIILGLGTTNLHDGWVTSTTNIIISF
jgi:hypothetical protein